MCERDTADWWGLQPLFTLVFLMPIEFFHICQFVILHSNSSWKIDCLQNDFFLNLHFLFCPICQQQQQVTDICRIAEWKPNKKKESNKMIVKYIILYKND